MSHSHCDVTGDRVAGSSVAGYLLVLYCAVAVSQLTESGQLWNQSICASRCAATAVHLLHAVLPAGEAYWAVCMPADCKLADVSKHTF
jgi:hypothetical protein